MKKIFLNLYLILYILFSPFLTNLCFAESPAKRRIAIVQIYDEAPSKELNELKIRIEKYLSTANNVVLVSNTDIAAWFGNRDPKKTHLTKGDRLFYQAEDLYYSFTPEKSYGLVKASIDELKKYPGTNGGLFKAYLMKAQIEVYMNKTAEAHQSLLQAISYNLGQEELSDFYYDPKTRHFYNKAYGEFVQKHEIINLNIYSRGNKKSPIYVNGVLRGYSPQVTIKVPSDQIQMVSAGNDPEAPLVAVSNQKQIRITAKQNIFDEDKMSPVGFRNDDSSHLIEKSYGLGSFVGADYIILLKMEGTGVLQKVNVMAMNVRKYNMTDIKVVEVHDLKKSYKSVTSVAGDFIMSLDASQSVAVQNGTTSVVKNDLVVKNKKSKSFFKSSAGKITIGALILGAASAIILGVASSAGESTTSSASVSGPAPTVPGD